eukprot:145465_1
MSSVSKRKHLSAIELMTMLVPYNVPSLNNAIMSSYLQKVLTLISDESTRLHVRLAAVELVEALMVTRPLSMARSLGNLRDALRALFAFQNKRLLRAVRRVYRLVFFTAQ